MAKDFQGNNVMKDKVWWQNAILYVALLFLLSFNWGAPLFGWYGDYGVAAQHTGFGFKLLGFALDGVATAALIYGEFFSMSKKNGAVVFLAFVAVALSCLAMIGFQI